MSAQLHVVIPVFNDWQSVDQVLEELDRVLSKQGTTADVLLVNDGSSEEIPTQFLSWEAQALEHIAVLHLFRNLGQQRAICMGIVSVYKENPELPLLIMDGDGEDSPKDVPRLLSRFFDEGQAKAVFAARRKRLESRIFVFFYQIYRALHWVFVGFDIRFGNFSIIPAGHVATLVRCAELWNHYAAALVKCQLPFVTVPVDRARRLYGRSRMSFVSLVVHGLSAMSVYSEKIAVRMLVIACVGLLVGLLTLFVVVALRLLTDFAIPGWSTLMFGMVLVMLVQVVTIAFLFTFGMLASRSMPPFIPIRDCPSLVMGTKRMMRAIHP